MPPQDPGAPAPRPTDAAALTELRGFIARIERGDTSIVPPWLSIDDALAELRRAEAEFASSPDHPCQVCHRARRQHFKLDHRFVLGT